MSDKAIHIIALSAIALAFLAKLVSLILIADLHYSLRIVEFFSIGAYFAYMGWLGFVRRNYREENGKYMIYATILVVLDVVTYYLFKGWD